MYRPQNINYSRRNINYSRRNTSSNKMTIIYGIIFILCIFVIIFILFSKKNDPKQILTVPVPVPVPVPVAVPETNMQNTEPKPTLEPESPLMEHILKDDDKNILQDHDIIMPDTSKIIPNQNGDYTIINAIVRDYTYYRLGVKTESEFNNTLYIQSIINSIIPMIKDNNIKDNLKRNKPLFLIGSSAHDFLELQSLKNEKTAEGVRNILDIFAFGPSIPIPGFISNIFNKCADRIYLDDNIVFHEFMHSIHFYGFSQEQKNVLKELYNKYNVISDNYNIKLYAFVNVYEFFAEMAQTYCQMKFGFDEAKRVRVTHKILKDNLPEMYTFLQSIFNIYPNHALNAICSNCNKDLLCCRDEYDNCPYWASIGDCNNIISSENMKTHCRKSCQVCQ